MKDPDLNQKIISIVIVQVSGLIASLSFVLFLPDIALAKVLALMAFFGLISMASASNITAKVYTNTAAGATSGTLARLSLFLLSFEQGLAIVFCIIVSFIELVPLSQLHMLELLSLAILSSNTSTAAFARHKASYLIRLNYVRAATTLARAGALHVVASTGQEMWISSIFIISLIPVFGYTLLITLRHRIELGKELPSTLVLLREYFLGIPVSLARAVFDQGIILLAVRVLDANDLRLFRFLLLPKDIFNRLFNAALPIIFDKLFEYRITISSAILVFVIAATLATVWYTVGIWFFSGELRAMTSFVSFIVLNSAAYFMLPVAWRMVHRNRAWLNTMAITFNTTVTGTVYWILQPQNLTDLFLIMSVYLLSYVFANLVIFRMHEQKNQELAR